MRVIVPLRGLLGGRYGLALGCVIPLFSFYFIQLRSKKLVLPSPPKPPEVDRLLLDEDIEVEAPIAQRALSIVSLQDTPYFLGDKEVADNPFDAVHNPTGCIELGLAENMLSLDLLQDWLSKWRYNPLDLKEGAGYVGFHGLKPLKIVLARFMGMVMEGRVKFESSQMVVTAGATASVEIMAFCLAQPGEAFLVPAPYYSGFDRDIKWRSQVDLIPVPCYSNIGFMITHDALKRTYRELRNRGTKVRGVFLTNPSNPVGNIIDRGELTSILSFIKEEKIHLIVDEVYAACVFEGCAFTSVAEVLDSDLSIRSYVHIIYGLSKDLGLAGFRVGVLYSWNKQVLEVAKRMTRFCATSTFTQQLCTSLLSDEDFMRTFLTENRRRITERYHRVVTELEKVGIHCARSSGGLFCWMSLRQLLHSYSKEEEIKLWKHLLYRVGLHLTPGSAWYCDEPGWFRLCFASVSDDILSVAIQRFHEFVLTPKY